MIKLCKGDSKEYKECCLFEDCPLKKLDCTDFETARNTKTYLVCDDTSECIRDMYAD